MRRRQQLSRKVFIVLLLTSCFAFTRGAWSYPATGPGTSVVKDALTATVDSFKGLKSRASPIRAAKASSRAARSDRANAPLRRTREPSSVQPARQDDRRALERKGQNFKGPGPNKNDPEMARTLEGHIYRNWPLYVGIGRTTTTQLKTERKDEEAQRKSALADKYLGRL